MHNISEHANGGKPPKCSGDAIVHVMCLLFLGITLARGQVMVMLSAC